MIKKIWKHIIFFIILFSFTFIFIISKGRNENILSIFSNINLSYMIFGVILMSIFVSCEALNIKMLLTDLGYKIKLLTSIKYASVGYFYSSITPSASGGQPMQLYHMSKDKIDISHSMITLLIIITSFQIVNLLFMVAGVIINHDYLLHTLNHLGFLFIIGISLNILVLTILLSIIFIPKTGELIIKIVKKIIVKLKINNSEEIIKKIDEEIEKYKTSSNYIRKNKRIFLRVLLVTTIQFFASYSISYVTYKSFGLSGVPYYKLVSLQAVLFSSISSIPLPGSMGISEVGFELLYMPIYGKKLISSAVLFTRASSFYITVIITSIISLIAYFQKPKIVSKNREN